MKPNPIVRYFPSVTVLIWIVLYSATLLNALALTDGILVYTLDDAYIHLSVAHNILLGGYGVNLGEYSSPSSSILWPWLAAIPEFLGLGFYGPLVINSLATMVTLVLASRFAVRNGIVSEKHPLAALLIALLLVAMTSAVALPLTGMEHTLHVLAVVCVIDGLVDVAEDRKPAWYLLPALMLLPLIRFEGAALSVISVLLLWHLGQRRLAGLAATAIVAAFALYGAFAHAHDLPFFPSSVLLKSRTVSAAAGDGPTVATVFHEISRNLSKRAGTCLAICMILLGLAAIAIRTTSRRLALVYALGSVCVAAHLFVGKIGWFFRYEVYAATLAGLLLLHAGSQLMRTGALGRIGVWAVPGLLAILSSDYATAAIDTPLAARNIYEQQYQMRRFIRNFYPQPVAVNDLGLVSYGNPNYVLDLWGLGSEPVRKLRATHSYGPEAMSRLVAAHEIGLVMIYRDWFTEIPNNWTPLATLKTTDNYVAGSDTVFFYSTAPEKRTELERALRAFAATLPERVTFTILPVS